MKEAAIPEKLFYKIGEVSALTSLRPSVLRFWESEFTFLQPQKSRTGQRLYSRKEIDLLLEIKRLLYTEKLTIEGAKRRIVRKEKAEIHQEDTNSDELHALLSDVRSDLLKIRDSL